MPKYYPAIRPESVIGARLYADRYQMLKDLGIPRGARIAEIGVAHGDFSDFLIREIDPSHFYALDRFDMEKTPVHWGVPQEVMFKGKTHHDFYRDRFASLGDRMIMMRGLSTDTAPNLPDWLLDLVYIDANHEYEMVSRDAAISAQKIKPDGVLVFNDYILFDSSMGVEYGVVQAVNELVDSGAWRVAGFALDRSMFCDIAIKRAQR
jgi:Methyltransferase domain